MHVTYRRTLGAKLDFSNNALSDRDIEMIIAGWDAMKPKEPSQPHMDLGAKNESVILGFFLSTLPAVDVYGHRALQLFGWPSGSSSRVATDAPLGVSDASSNAAAPQCDISG